MSRKRRAPANGPGPGNRQTVGVEFSMAKQSLLREFFAFIRHEKKWWMIPLVLVLLVVGGLILFASSSPLAPFIYPLF